MFIAPMPMETADEPFDSEDFIFEPKLDGRRMFFSRIGGETMLYSRGGTETAAPDPSFAESIPDGTVLDGEMACADGGDGKFRYIAYDIIQHGGKDIRSMPLIRRKEILAGLPISDPRVAVMPFVENRGSGLFASASRLGLEGIVAKAKDGRYDPRRGERWRMIVNWTCREVVIAGYCLSEFGWLAAIPSEEGYVPAGWIRRGPRAEHKRRFYEVCRDIESGKHKDTVFLEPLLKASVKSRGVGKNGMLRDPVFLSFL
mgnify:FL=1